MSSQSSTPNLGSIPGSICQSTAEIDHALDNMRSSPSVKDSFDAFNDAFSWAQPEIPPSLSMLLTKMKANPKLIEVFKEHDWIEPKTLVEVANSWISATMDYFTNEELELDYVLQAIIYAITIGSYIGESCPVFNKYAAEVLKKMTLEEYTSLLESKALNNLDSFYQQIEVKQLGQLGRSISCEARHPDVMRYLERSRLALERKQ